MNRIKEMSDGELFGLFSFAITEITIIYSMIFDKTNLLAILYVQAGVFGVVWGAKINSNWLKTKGEQNEKVDCSNTGK